MGIYISNKSPGDADTGGLGHSLRVSVLQSYLQDSFLSDAHCVTCTGLLVILMTGTFGRESGSLALSPGCATGPISELTCCELSWLPGGKSK